MRSVRGPYSGSKCQVLHLLLPGWLSPGPERGGVGWGDGGGGRLFFPCGSGLPGASGLSPGDPGRQAQNPVLTFLPGRPPRSWLGRTVTTWPGGGPMMLAPALPHSRTTAHPTPIRPRRGSGAHLTCVPTAEPKPGWGCSWRAGGVLSGGTKVQGAALGAAAAEMPAREDRRWVTGIIGTVKAGGQTYHAVAPNPARCDQAPARALPVTPLLATTSPSFCAWGVRTGSIKPAGTALVPLLPREPNAHTCSGPARRLPHPSTRDFSCAQPGACNHTCCPWVMRGPLGELRLPVCAEPCGHWTAVPQPSLGHLPLLPSHFHCAPPRPLRPSRLFSCPSRGRICSGSGHSTYNCALSICCCGPLIPAEDGRCSRGSRRTWEDG